jgi:hypothetical protein
MNYVGGGFSFGNIFSIAISSFPCYNTIIEKQEDNFYDHFPKKSKQNTDSF